MVIASGFSWREAHGARHLHQLTESAHFRPRRGGAVGRDAVVPASLVVFFGRGSLARFDDEPLLQHPLDGAIQRPGAELEIAARALRDVLDDRVAVAVLFG